MGNVIKNEQTLSLEEMLEIIKTAQESNIDISSCVTIVRCYCPDEVTCNCNCNCGGSENPGPGPDPDPGPNPGPGDGEPTGLYVTPDVTAFTAANNIKACNDLLFSWHADDIITYGGVPHDPSKATGIPTNYRYWGTKTSSKGVVEYYFKRPQYITGYEIGVAQVNTYSPKSWDLYLSKDGGENWTLAHSEEFNMSTIASKSWALEPGFYNAYKLDVKSTCNNSRIALFSLRMLGLPTEVIPVNPATASRYGVTITGSQVTNPLNASWVYIDNHYAQMAENSYINYQFDDVRQARSFGIIVQNDRLTGWDILGSNDGMNWETIFSITNETLIPGEEKEYNFSQTALYEQYRLVATEVSDQTQAFLTYFQLYR